MAAWRCSRSSKTGRTGSTTKEKGRSHRRQPRGVCRRVCVCLCTCAPHRGRPLVHAPLVSGLSLHTLVGSGTAVSWSKRDRLLPHHFNSTVLFLHIPLWFCVCPCLCVCSSRPRAGARAGVLGWAVGGRRHTQGTSVEVRAQERAMERVGAGGRTVCEHRTLLLAAPPSSCVAAPE